MIEFFADGVIPGKSADFLAAFRISTERERLLLSALIRDFTPDQIKDYCYSILGQASDEQLLAMTFLAPDVIEKMNVETLEQHLRLIYKLNRLARIRPEFYEQCAESLVLHCNPLLEVNFLGLLYSVKEDYGLVRSYDLELLQGNVLDQAVSTSLEEILQKHATPNDFMYYSGGLASFELPTTLEVFLRNSMESEDGEWSVKLVSSLFSENKLTGRYLEVCRRVLGDQQLIDILQGDLAKARRGGQHNSTRLRSVASLASIFGEATFHSPQFLESLFSEDGEGHVPRYIYSLEKIGFYELDLPVLRAFIVENLERLIFFKPAYISELDLTINLMSLAHQEGVGAKALTLLLQRMGDLIGGEAFDDPFAVLIESLFDAPIPTERSRGNAFLHHVVEKVELKTLHEVVPDVGVNFLSEYLEKKKPAMNEREMLRLFPQIRGKLLEDRLGL
jgi:hypothetical protein